MVYNNKAISVGAFHEMIELANLCGIEIISIIDNDERKTYKGIKIICKDEEVDRLKKQLIDYPLILTPDKPEVRVKLFEYYSIRMFNFLSLISPKSNISKTSHIGKGTVIQSLSNISSNSRLGNFVKINSGANVMHDVKVGDFTTIAPNAVILGKANIGNKCYIGANATILPNIVIEDNVIIGAGAVVTKNVKANRIVKGVPAK